MYKCQNCGKVSQPGERAVRVVLSTRDVTYQCGGELRRGFETAREALVCPTCAQCVVPHAATGEPKLVDCAGCYTEPRHRYSCAAGRDGEARMDYGRNVLRDQAEAEEDVFWVWDAKTNTFHADYPTNGPGPYFE